MTVTWKDYLSAHKGDAETYRECCLRFREAFEQQRANITRVFEARSPKVVACLGAGVLNDIPYDLFVRSGAKVHLVDWMPSSIEAGIGLSIIDVDENGCPRCVYCDPSVECPEAYCRHYRRQKSSDTAVCDEYKQAPSDPPRCAAFARGDEPDVRYEDVTGGYASEFGHRVPQTLRGVRTWKQAFVEISDLAQRVKSHRTPLSIDDDSVDLVTSSMVVSQLDEEPYDYFSYRAGELLGRPKQREESRLLPSMEALRSILLANQVERHCEEIKRILAPDGVCYMSFEMFHFNPEAGQWFVVAGMSKALAIIGRWFNFNFDIIAPNETLATFDRGKAPSLVGSFVLEPKAA
ncbi:MAG: hypothetical protein IIB99_04870 [Planctomycetes bacterium]|nr:hypothetical protein [Planctomycetota bacterium]